MVKPRPNWFGSIEGKGECCGDDAYCCWKLSFPIRNIDPIQFYLYIHWEAFIKAFEGSVI